MKGSRGPHGGGLLSLDSIVPQHGPGKPGLGEGVGESRGPEACLPEAGRLVGETSSLREEALSVCDMGTWLLRLPGLLRGGQTPVWDGLVHSVRERLA